MMGDLQESFPAATAALNLGDERSKCKKEFQELAAVRLVTFNESSHS
jgi:hypothetical protein